MTQSKHTPLPWAITQMYGTTSVMAQDGRRHICSTGGYIDYQVSTLKENEANANFIITACNAYEANQTTIKTLTEALEEISCPSQTKNLLWWQKLAREALKKAGKA